MKNASRHRTFSKIAAFAAAAIGACAAAFFAVKMVAAFSGPTQAPPSGSGAISVNGSNVGVNGSITGNAFIPGYASWNAYGTGGGGAAIYDDNGTYKALMIVGNNSAGGNREVGIWDDLSVNGNLTVSGTFSGSSYTGTVGAGNISAGTFGANTGGGNYTFPGGITVDSGLTVDGSAGSQYGGSGEILANGDNHLGGGINVSDDGGFYDYNDGYITYNGSTGLKIAGNNGAGSSGSLYVQGAETVTGQMSAASYCISGANCITAWPSGSGSGTIGGSGTANYVPLFTAGTTLGNSVISQSGTTITVGGNLSVGSNKITAGTIDPVYTIDGTDYATYVPGMTGEKEETAGTLDLTKQTDGTWSAVIDFAKEPTGSDLWLFAQATNLKNSMSALIVSLTPSFDGRVWYTKDAADDALTVHGAAATDAPASLEVSYILTAPRFDSAAWTNLAPAEDAGTTGFIINTGK